MSLEGGPVLQMAVNEMLLQSYSGTLRVFPAVPKDWEGHFRLHAAGGFIVSAAYENEKVSYLVIESRTGEVCRLANPYPGQSIRLYQWDEGQENWSLLYKLSGEDLEFSTKQGSTYLILPEVISPETLKSTLFTGEKNSQFKQLGSAKLGIPKGF